MEYDIVVITLHDERYEISTCFRGFLCEQLDLIESDWLVEVVETLIVNG